MDDLAAIVEGLLVTQRRGRRVVRRKARVAAIAAVGAILAIIDSWLRDETALSHDEVVSCCTTCAQT